MTFSIWTLHLNHYLRLRGSVGTNTTLLQNIIISISLAFVLFLLSRFVDIVEDLSHRIPKHEGQGRAYLASLSGNERGFAVGADMSGTAFSVWVAIGFARLLPTFLTLPTCRHFRVFVRGSLVILLTSR